MRLAKRLNGVIAAPVLMAYIWGEGDRLAADARIVNLQTAVTRGGARGRARTSTTA